MSIYLSEEWRRIKDDLTIKFLKDERFQLNDPDKEAVRQAYEMVLRVRKHKACHYACCALFGSGKFKCGTQVYCRRMHEFSICAEHRPIERASWRIQSGDLDPIITLATFHGGHDSSGNYTRNPYLSSPCEKCLRMLHQVSPDALIVADLDGEGRLAKIPLEAIEFFRHPTKHNGE